MDLPVLMSVYSVLFSLFVIVLFLRTRKQAIVHLVIVISFVYLAEVIPTFLELYGSNSLEALVELSVTLAELCITATLVPLFLHWINVKTGGKLRLIAGKTGRRKDVMGIIMALALFITGISVSMVLPLPPGMIDLPMSMALFITALVHFLATNDMFLKFTDLNIIKMVLYPFIATNLLNSFPLVIITMVIVNLTFILVMMAGFDQHDSLQVTRWEVPG